KLTVDIDEADVGQVREGQQATFAVDAFPDKRFPAAIVALRFAPHRTQDVVTYEAVLDVDNSERLLRPGMTAVAEIVTEEIEDVLLVPNSALRFTPPDVEETNQEQDASEQDARSASARKPRVWILRDGKPEAVDVVVGRTDGRRTEILQGGAQPGMALLVDVVQ
ncbi:MAG: efflux RND transporter periplasmic adaptor subunit, partial [Planctomycetales bacterium]